MKDVKCPVCGSPATLEESGWCFCKNTACLCAWSVMCTDKIAAVTAERDGYLRRMHACHLTFDKYGMDQNNELLDVLVDRTVREFWTVTSDRDALSDALADVRQQLAALKKRVADAPRQTRYPSDDPNENIRIALLRLEDGEA